jgi:polyribonucleotide nucleotidyltransferase
VNVGDKLQVEILEIDQRGKISLGLVDDESGAKVEGEPAPAGEPAEA